MILLKLIMLYFKDRNEAGKTLASQLGQYKGQKNALIALSDGAVMVAKSIAEEIPAVITLLVTEAIAPPGEDIPVGYIDQDGAFVENKLLTSEELRGFTEEYRTLIEQQKLEKLHRMIALAGGKNIFPQDKLHDYNIMMVADGFSSGPLIDSLVDLLKPIRIKNFVIAVPVACVTTVERINRYSDDVHALGIADFYKGPDHYFEDNTIPPHEEILKIVEDSIARWQF